MAGKSDDQGSGRQGQKGGQESGREQRASGRGQDSGREQRASGRGHEGGQSGDSESRQSRGRGSQESRSSGGSDDLKEREYRDAEGNIHHHTRTYMEQHGKK
jgi:hypothetical protein